MVCSSRSLDQFLAREPDYLLKQGAEEARIDPSNAEILLQHLKCATFEAPFELSARGTRPAHPETAEGEAYATLDVSATRDALDYLAQQSLVHARNGRYFWTGEAYPASHVSLRSIGWDNFIIIDELTGKSLAELDWRASHTMLHEQAIYQHDAEQYQVERLDYENHKAYVRKVAPDYFTTALTYRDVEVIEEMEVQKHQNSIHGFGEVKVIEKVTGYKKIKFNTHENAGYGDVHLPEMQMHTTAFWLALPESVVEALAVPRATVIESLRALGLAFETVCTLALMCEPQDLNRTLGNGYDSGGDAAVSEDPARDTPGARALPGRNREQRGEHEPTLFLFDAQPGGVGLARRIYHRAPQLLADAAQLIRGCPCADGCPGCIGPSASRGPRKLLAVRLAELTQ
jgi:DEAD/DEAH box helicase domain-containing protein